QLLPLCNQPDQAGGDFIVSLDIFAQTYRIADHCLQSCIGKLQLRTRFEWSKRYFKTSLNRALLPVENWLVLFINTLDHFHHASFDDLVIAGGVEGDSNFMPRIVGSWNLPEHRRRR